MMLNVVCAITLFFSGILFGLLPDKLQQNDAEFWREESEYWQRWSGHWQEQSKLSLDLSDRGSPHPDLLGAAYHIIDCPRGYPHTSRPVPEVQR